MDRIKVYSWAVVAAAAAFLATSLVAQPSAFPRLPILIFWVGALVVAELLPVTLGFETRITMGYPILLAAAILFEPGVTMVIAGLGSLDLRELRTQIPVHRALFNRAQAMLHIGAASAIMSLSGDLLNPFFIAAAAAADLIINLGLVSVAVHMEHGIPLREVARKIPPSPLAGFLLSYALLTALGAATAAASRQGTWVVVAILVPLLFARMAISGARSREELSERVLKQQEALRKATERVLEDREQERARIAAHIHDTSLQMLAAASYGSANTSKLLSTGDVGRARESSDMVREALDEAMGTLRDSLVDLRRSAVEAGGLLQTVTRFADQLSTVWGANIAVKADLESEPPISVALAAVQIVQEALVNALKHAGSDEIRVNIAQNDGAIVVVVEDDGGGFDLQEEKGAEHVGMQLMQERAAGVGGTLDISSTPGRGTSIAATLPAGVGLS
ncbi:MAG: hypothetical protein GEU78_06220 [Actinobacteria bacterium]|nr:hypothetical protein [Actinomycetota bacterium]